MRYFVLATDYDGTLAHDGTVTDETIAALDRLRQSDRKVVLVTGRTLEDLFNIFPRLDMFDRVVGENGAVVYRPEDKTQLAIGERPPEAFIQALRTRGVSPLRVGHVILDTWESERDKVLDAVHEQGLELQLIFNKGSLMVLPTGINKAVGLKAALDEMRLSTHNSVAVGDAENDLAMLKAAECGAAVAGALDTVKAIADVVMSADHGPGVQELIGRIIEDDLAHAVRRHDILLGAKLHDAKEDGSEIHIPVYGRSILLSGSSGGGKSTLTTGFIERLLDAGYQVCVIDPEGDYQELGGASVLGGKDRAPDADELIDALKNPWASIVLNLMAIAGEERPTHFKTLLPRLLELRSQTGRPHWIIVDEAHHVMPASADTSHLMVPEHVGSMMLITTDPAHVTKTLIAKIDVLLAVGDEPAKILQNFCGAAGEQCPDTPNLSLKKGEAMMWSRGGQNGPELFRVAESRTPRVRHSRKYAAGEIEPERSFYFRGPDGRLNLRAQNLRSFLQIAGGIDQETWDYHRDRGDYSRWFRDIIRSEELADDAVEIEGKKNLPQQDAVDEMRIAIEKRFTLPG